MGATRVITDMRISASKELSATPAEVYAFLREAENHRRLQGSMLSLIDVCEGPDGQLSGRMVIRGPLGARREVRTRVLWNEEPRLLGGIAEAGARTTALVRWDLAGTPTEGTRVELSARVSEASLFDRALLLAGGRSWMRRLLEDAVHRLAAHVPAAAG